MGWTKRWRKRLRALLRKDAVERELEEELALHLALETEKNLRAGMSPEEARRQAALAFGGVEKHKEEVRDARVLGWVPGMSLDFKLGFRMLVKYPGLTLVGSLAISVAVGLGAAYFEFVNDFLDPEIPLEDGDRIVSIYNWDAESTSPEMRSLHDYVHWRNELRSIELVGAFIWFQPNLILEDGLGTPVEAAEISASAFRLTRVAPMLGRTLIDADEQVGAEPVVVVGYDVWQTRFGGNPDVVGRTLRLGEASYTVVGVMPDGFAFPFRHSIWVPLRRSAGDYTRLAGPPIQVFGRLAPGASLEDARTEVRTLGARAAAAFPETNRHLEPRVHPFAQPSLDRDDMGAGAMYSLNLLFVMVMVLACANVATLMFARIASRQREITIRDALGASRERIVLQLFVEALVLTSLAAALGLAAAGWGLRRGMQLYWDMAGGEAPFWWDYGLSATTIGYVVALTLLGALIAGVVPAMKATGQRVQERLQRLGAGSIGMKFGGMWTTVIIVQVAVSVALLPEVAWEVRDAMRSLQSDVGLPADAYLSVQLRMTTETLPGDSVAGAASTARFEDAYQELGRRLQSRRGIAGVAVATMLPGMAHPQRAIEVDGNPGSHEVRTASVDMDFFAALNTPIVSGRGFHSAEIGSDARTVVVNQSFVQEVLAGANPLGRRIREAPQADEEPHPWKEIVGVAPDLGMNSAFTSDPEQAAGIYYPLVPSALRNGDVYYARMAIQVVGDPTSFAAILRSTATAVDPTLRLYDIRPLSDVAQQEQTLMLLTVSVFSLVGLIALMLSTVGSYSLMSFAVSQRRREIGVRAALGAGPRRITTAIFSRAAAQLGAGVIAGGTLSALMSDELVTEGPEALLGVMALMLAVGLGACLVPARRALRIQPTEALRAEN